MPHSLVDDDAVSICGGCDRVVERESIAVCSREFDWRGLTTRPVRDVLHPSLLHAVMLCRSGDVDAARAAVLTRAPLTEVPAGTPLPDIFAMPLFSDEFVAASGVVSCRLVSSRVVSCRLVSSRVVSCRLVSSRVVSCRLVSSRVAVR